MQTVIGSTSAFTEQRTFDKAVDTKMLLLTDLSSSKSEHSIAEEIQKPC